MVSEVVTLGAANSTTFQEKVQAAMPASLNAVEIDLSQTNMVDSCGLGALLALYKTARVHNSKVTFRLLNPNPLVRQLFELTQMYRFFEIVKH